MGIVEYTKSKSARRSISKSSKFTPTDIFCFLGVALAVVAFIVVFVGGSVDFTFGLVLLIFLLSAVGVAQIRNGRMLLFLFYFTFFLFLLGNTMVSLADGKGAGFDQFTAETNKHIAIVLVLSLLSISGGYLFFEKKVNMSFYKSEIPVNANIKRASKFIFFALLVFDILISVDKGMQVAAGGYNSLYTEYRSNLPSLFISLATVSKVSFFIFLGTLPSKKEVRLPVAAYILASAGSLLYGQRSAFATALVLIIAYYVIRKAWFPGGEAWLKKRSVVGLACLAPVLMIFFYFFGFLRAGSSFDFSFGVVSDFVSQQSKNTSQLLGYGYDYRDFLNPNVLYTISPLGGIFTQNSFVHAVFQTPIFDGYNIDRALHGFDYSHAIMYQISPVAYLSASALGSCYIAEAYHDFGYIGVIGINLLYGGLLASAPLFIKRGPIVSALYFMMINEIYYAPRSTASGFITATFTLTTLFSILLVIVFAKMLYARSIRQREKQ